MDKFFVIVLLTICFVSCKTVNVPLIQEGTFSKNYDYYFAGSRIISEEELILNRDSTFSIVFNGVVINKCQGKWYYLDNKTIHLKCNDEEKYYLTLRTGSETMPQDTSSKFLFDPALMNGYMRVRERNVKIVNENKIKLEMPELGGKKYIVLKRVTE